jgi:predicted DNA-binding protein
MIRLTPEDYDRLSALAASEGVAVAVKAREVMLAGMDPQIFGERYYDVERLLRSVVRAEMETHSERLHRRLYRVGGITAAMVYFVREILSRVLELDPQGVTRMWREAEGHGFKYMGAKRPGLRTDDEGPGSTS